MRLGEAVTLMVHGGRALPDDVERITQAINRFRPITNQLNAELVTPLELLAALESMDPVIKDVLKGITIETVDQPAIPYSEGKPFSLKRMGMGKVTLFVLVIIITILVAVNGSAIIYLSKDSEVAMSVMRMFIDLISVLLEHVSTST